MADRTANEISFLSELVVLLCYAGLSVKDNFWRRKLQKGASVMVSGYLAVQISAKNQSGDVAQHIGKINFLRDVDQLLELTASINYLRLLSPATVANLCVLLLSFKLLIVKSWAAVPKRIIKESSGSVDISHNEKVETSAGYKGVEISGTKKKIFNFIKSFPHVRTKDILEEFGSLSARTVKRGLKDLSELNLIGKKAEKNAVYYFVT